MTLQSFDPVRYKEGQRQGWGSAAPAWKRWWKRIEPDLQPVSDRMMELADLQTGQRLLDVATGLGEPAVTAARRVGPSGHVVATDLSSDMLDIGRERADKLGLENIDFRQMDAEALTLPQQSFDAIFCRFGLMYLPDLQKALDGMCNLLVPGGCLVAAVWGMPQKVPFISVPMDVAQRELEVPPPSPELPGAFRLANTHTLRSMFRQVGFAGVYTEPMSLLFRWLSVDDFVSFQQELLMPLNALLAQYSIERQINVWRAIARAAEQYMVLDGTIDMENEALLVVGRA
jgi:ubiquinone/menaquinone biosynthesis C-methylase UbiE